MSELVERLRSLMTAWEKPGELTPSEPVPSIYMTAKEAADRIEALEAALRDIAKTEIPNHWAALDAIQSIARAALAPWPQDAIDQEMIERTDDGWKADCE